MQTFIDELAIDNTSGDSEIFRNGEDATMLQLQLQGSANVQIMCKYSNKEEDAFDYIPINPIMKLVEGQFDMVDTITDAGLYQIDITGVSFFYIKAGGSCSVYIKALG